MSGFAHRLNTRVSYFARLYSFRAGGAAIARGGAGARRARRHLGRSRSVLRRRPLRNRTARRPPALQAQHRSSALATTSRTVGDQFRVRLQDPDAPAWTLYAGGGPAINFYSFDDTRRQRDRAGLQCALRRRSRRTGCSSKSSSARSIRPTSSSGWAGRLDRAGRLRGRRPLRRGLAIARVQCGRAEADRAGGAGLSRRSSRELQTSGGGSQFAARVFCARSDSTRSRSALNSAR